MTYYSAIIPQRDSGAEVRRQLPALVATLAALGRSFEIVVVDDGSSLEDLRQLDQPLRQLSSLRVVRLEQPCGVSVALAAGIQAARGEVILATEPGEYYPAVQLADLVRWLERADLVVGRRRRFGWSKFYQRVARLPRALLLGLDSHDPDCLFWAARREALADLTLMPGMARYLSALVGRRGFRVYETYVEHATGMHRLEDVRPNPADLLATWWQCRRWRPIESRELIAGQRVESSLRVVGIDGVASSIERRAHVDPRNSPAGNIATVPEAAEVISIAQAKTA